MCDAECKGQKIGVGLVSENCFGCVLWLLCVMQDAGVKVDIDLVSENRLVIGSGCVRVLMMQCVMVFLFCRRSHGDGVICCRGLIGAYLNCGQIRLPSCNNCSWDCWVVCTCVMYLLLSRGN